MFFLHLMVSVIGILHAKARFSKWHSRKSRLNIHIKRLDSSLWVFWYFLNQFNSWVGFNQKIDWSLFFVILRRKMNSNEKVTYKDPAWNALTAILLRSWSFQRKFERKDNGERLRSVGLSRNASFHRIIC